MCACARACCLFKLPDDVTLAEGSLVENLASAVAAVRLARLEVTERVVIVGATPIGLLALQVARLASPSTLVMAGTGEKRLALAEGLGASATVDIEQVDLVLDRFREEYDNSLIYRRFTIDTTDATPEESLQTFLKQLWPHLSQGDRLRMLSRLETVSAGGSGPSI